MKIPMYKAPSKRKKRTQLFFVYALMVGSVVAIVSILVLIMLGYRFNRFDGRVEQGGLVQFDSRPSGATVTVDQTQLANKTASKITLTTGKHTITMTRDGYTAWKKDVNVKAGTILWLNYALMVPNKINSTVVSEQTAVSSTLASPDKKYLAMVGAPSEPVITVMPLNDQTPVPAKVTIPAGTFTVPDADKPSVFTLKSWDKENRHALVEHTYNDGVSEYIYVDLRGQDAARNITTSFGLSLQNIAFSLQDSNQLYALTTDHELRRVSLADNTISAPLLTNVADFDQGDRSTLTFTTLPDPSTNKRSAGYLTVGRDKAKIINSTASVDAPYFVRMTGYYNDKFFVIADGQDVSIVTGDVPVSDSMDTLSLTRVAQYRLGAAAAQIDFSPYESRFVYAVDAKGVVVYDLELHHLSRTPAEGIAQTRPLNWLNTYHFATTQGGEFAYYDFDGTNRHVIATKALDMPAIMSENNRYFYHYTTTDKGVGLVRTKLLTD